MGRMRGKKNKDVRCAVEVPASADVLKMKTHSPRADAKLLGDHFALIAAQESFEHLPFAGCQVHEFGFHW